jgi:HSP20 family protein
VVEAELPGVQKEDTEVTLEQGDLVIRGERKAREESKEQHYYRMERSYGTFHRRIPLPFEVKPEQITANFKDGVLEVQVPKPPQEQPKPKPIAIS